MPGPRGEQCAKCYFGVDQDLEAPGQQLWCYRYPPAMPYVEDRKNPEKTDPSEPWQPVAVWWSGWCGEFKPRDASASDQ